ncbi:MAG: aldo/keto reductase [Candidatus Bathyarchaeota archaeon]|nr:aldo/keto reductase [Candidatus Bathyarchaeota archaeon]
MQYRSFGKLDWKVSALGFGTMRLPIIGNNQANVNEAEAIALIRYAVDEGVNYVDSAFTYHDGNSEIVIGKALAGKYRGKAKIATKIPVFSVNRREDLDRILNLQMKRLNTDFIDFYLFHSLTKTLWSKVLKLEMLEWAEQQVKKGRLGYLGFSFHDELEVFKEIVDSYDNWTLSQIQYNYLDENYQAGRRGLKYAASKGLAVVVMEPLAGGLLAVNPPVEIQEEWQKADVKRSAPDWALQWVWNHPEVSVALSGMNTMQHVKENLQSACHSGPNTLNQNEIALLSKSRKLYLKQGYIGCTKCYYCIQCPQSIDIPLTLAFLNVYSTKRSETQAQSKIKQEYAKNVPPEKRASNCLHCGQCEAICPQHLPVRKLLYEAALCLE